jgi:K+-sensing histidine kinase KdpD
MRPLQNAHRRGLADGSPANGNVYHRDYLMRALSHDDHLAAVVGSIFTLSRAAEHGAALQLSDVPVRELLAEVHALVEPFADAEGVALVVDWEHAPTVVRGQHTALLWALMNLACRVVKSTPGGGIVELSAIVLLNTVELRVAHMGTDRACVPCFSFFGPIEYVHATDEVEIARDLTRLMGGELLVHNTEGAGALYAMRFHAAWRPARRLALTSMAKAA